MTNMSIANMKHQSCFEVGNRLLVVTDLDPVFEATMQRDCTEW